MKCSKKFFFIIQLLKLKFQRKCNLKNVQTQTCILALFIIQLNNFQYHYNVKVIPKINHYKLTIITIDSCKTIC